MFFAGETQAGAMATKTLDFRQADSSDSPYLRRQRAGAIRRRRKPRRARRLGKWILLLLFVLVSSAGAAYWFQMTHPDPFGPFRFSSSEVRVQGNRYVTRREILENLDLRRMGSLFDFSLESRRRQLEEINWVREASLVRLLPNGLGVWIQEREPVAFVRVADRIKLMDSAGVVLETPLESSFDFPVLTGWNGSGAEGERRGRLRLYEKFIGDWESVPQREWSVSEVNVSDPEDLKAVLVAGSESILVHFGREDFARRFRNFLNFIPRIRPTQVAVRSVDLRFKNQIVVNSKF